MLCDAPVACTPGGAPWKTFQEKDLMNAVGQLQALGYRLLGYEPAIVQVERYEPKRHRDLWECFISASANGNLFQTRRFLEYHPDGRFQDHSLLFRHDTDLVAVAAGEAANDAWSSHRFTSHGGIAVRSHL